MWIRYLFRFAYFAWRVLRFLPKVAITGTIAVLSLTNFAPMSIKQKMSKFRVDFWIWIIGALYGYKASFLRLVSAQAMLETGRYSGSVFTKGKNAFGMQAARKRKQFGKRGVNSEGEPWVIFWCPFFSVLDQFRYFKLNGYSNSIQTPKEFASVLKINQYFESSQNDYQKNIEYYTKEEPITPLYSVVIAAVLLVAVPFILIVGVVRLFMNRSFIWKFWKR